MVLLSCLILVTIIGNIFIVVVSFCVCYSLFNDFSSIKASINAHAALSNELHRAHFAF